MLTARQFMKVEVATDKSHAPFAITYSVKCLGDIWVYDSLCTDLLALRLLKETR